MAGKPEKRVDASQVMTALLAGQGLLVAIAYALGRFVIDIDPLATLQADLVGIVFGVGGAAVLVAAMALARSLWTETGKRLDRQLLDMFDEIGLRLTPANILLLGLAAGICEEFLFRGTLQMWGMRELGWLAGLVLPNILFALLHPHSRAYVIYVFAIGLCLGALLLLTGNLLAPIIAHALYDHVALWRLKKLAEIRQS